MARQASSQRAWNSISNFYRRCREGANKKGYPQFKKHSVLELINVLIAKLKFVVIQMQH